jgi:hypothetical protein
VSAWCSRTLAVLRCGIHLGSDRISRSHHNGKAEICTYSCNLTEESDFHQFMPQRDSEPGQFLTPVTLLRLPVRKGEMTRCSPSSHNDMTMRNFFIKA